MKNLVGHMKYFILIKDIFITSHLFIELSHHLWNFMRS